jgi:hypothetical protein
METENEPLLKTEFENTENLKSIEYNAKLPSGRSQRVVVEFKDGKRFFYQDVTIDLLKNLFGHPRPDVFFDQHFLHQSRREIIE